MVFLSAVQASNASISKTLNPGSVAVFVGATSGIGETSMKQYARYSKVSQYGILVGLVT